MPLERADFARVNVVGVSGSGKSTVARELARRLNSPYVEMDALYWRSGWEGTPDPEFFAKLEAALAGDRWVLDGNYDRTMPVKWKRATAVVWVDYPFWRTFLQSLGRALSRMITRRELWPGTGNQESFRRTFLSRESVLLWMWQSFDRVRERYEQRMQDPAYSHIRFVRLRSPGESRKFIESVTAARN